MNKLTQLISAMALVSASLAFSDFQASGYSKLMDQMRAKEAISVRSNKMCEAMNRPAAQMYSKLLDQIEARRLKGSAVELSSFGMASLPSSTYSKLKGSEKHFGRARDSIDCGPIQVCSSDAVIQFVFQGLALFSHACVGQTTF